MVSVPIIHRDSAARKVQGQSVSPFILRRNLGSQGNTRTDHINQKKMDRGFNALLKELPFQHTSVLNKSMSICIVNVLFYITLIVLCNFYFYCQWLLCGPAGLI